MQKTHSQEWFTKQEAKLQEPIKNTKRYYYKNDIVKICTVVLAYWGIRNLLKIRRYLNSYVTFSTDILNKGRTVTNDGPPGSGKTFTGANTAYFLSIQRWQEMQSEYFLQLSMVTKWVKECNLDKLYAFKALEESYIFYKEREAQFIPCLISTVPLREYGTNRMSYVLPPEIFLQIERCPEGSVMFNDESGMLFGAETSKTENSDLKDFWRFIRHMIDAMSINTNQDGSQNGIYMRRSTDYVNHLYGQEWELRPVRLERKLEKKENRYYKRIFSGKLSSAKAEYIGQKLYYLKKYIKTIGFRRIRHKLRTPSGEAVGDEEEIVLPAIGGVEYDDRAYRNYYKCKDKKINLQGWEHLVLDTFDRSEYDKRISGEVNAENGGA